MPIDILPQNCEAVFRCRTGKGKRSAHSRQVGIIYDKFCITVDGKDVVEGNIGPICYSPNPLKPFRVKCAYVFEIFSCALTYCATIYMRLNLALF